MIKENDSVLVFEYFTASGEKDKSIISEAEKLLFSLLKDLSEIKVDLVINKSYGNIVKEYNNINPILINENIVDWLEVNASKFKSAIFIAAENNNNLYIITKILEENNVKTYTSNSKACLLTSDKYGTYQALPDNISQPDSFKVEIDSKGNWMGEIVNLYEKLQIKNSSKSLKLIIKPLLGVDCEGIVLLENIDDLSYDLENIFPLNSSVIVQEYIEGQDVSVSLISDGKNALPISLNQQFIELKCDGAKYAGGKLPYDSKYSDVAFEMAKNAVESIDGLKGFVGVDLKISDDGSVYLLEINSRFTTPYVGLSKIARFNIAQSIIDLIDGKIDIGDLDCSLDGCVEFIKSGDLLDIRRL